MKRRLLSLGLCFLLIGLLIGCGETTPSTPAPEVTTPSEQPTPAPEPEPEPKPAEFTLSNLRVEIGDRVQGSMEYECVVSVDVSNVGGSSGLYEFMFKVNDKDKDICKVELAPGETKTVTALKAEMEIRSLRFLYERGDEGIGREHIVSVNGLSKTITLPYAPPPLKAQLEIDLSSDFSNPYMGKVFVKLTNVGDAPATDIEIKVEFLDAGGNIIGIETLDTWDTEGIIIQPNKSESFEITTFSSKVIEELDNYHAYVKWNTIK